MKSCECSCFTALALVEDACTNFDAMDKATKVAKKACTSPSEKGSFGDCRAQERKVAYYGETCKSCPSGMTTKVNIYCEHFQNPSNLFSGSELDGREAVEGEAVPTSCWKDLNVQKIVHW